MSDIVARLHAMIDANYGDVAADSVYGSAMSDAADEIARLRADWETARDAHDRRTAEVVRLRAALEDLFLTTRCDKTADKLRRILDLTQEKQE